MFHRLYNSLLKPWICSFAFSKASPHLGFYLFFLHVSPSRPSTCLVTEDKSSKSQPVSFSDWTGPSSYSAASKQSHEPGHLSQSVKAFRQGTLFYMYMLQDEWPVIFIYQKWREGNISSLYTREQCEASVNRGCEIQWIIRASHKNSISWLLYLITNLHSC